MSPTRRWRNWGWDGRTIVRCISSAAIPGLTVSALLAILRITKQSLARVLNLLVEKGYVSQAPGYEDRRLRLLTLTEKGQALERRLFEASARLLTNAYRKAGPQAVDGFRAVMRALMDEGARAYVDGTGSAEDASMWTYSHILVVEDDPRLRERLARYLSGEGFRVTASGDAAEAAGKLRAINPDLMVLDVMMPGESGLDLVQSLRTDAQYTDLPGAAADRARRARGPDRRVRGRRRRLSRQAVRAARTGPAHPRPAAAGDACPGAGTAVRPDPDRRRGIRSSIAASCATTPARSD